MLEAGFTTSKGNKVWAWGHELLPDLVLLDPRLTVSLPADITSGTGLDAMVHAIEACTCRNRNPMADAPWNDAHWENERFNKLLIEARAEIDEKKRATLYAEMQQICKDEGGTIIPMFAQIVEANSDKIAHGPISAHMESDGHRNTERWWFK